MAQNTQPPSNGREAAPPTASPRTYPHWRPLLRWTIRTVPPTHEEHHRRRLLEIARREREAEALRRTATAPGSQAFR